VEGFCDYSNEPLDSLRGGCFPEQLSDFKFTKKGSGPWS
jgi:hypothetical protein